MPSWSRKEFVAFKGACERFGRKAYDQIASCVLCLLCVLFV
jgi:hypothetical protein